MTTILVSTSLKKVRMRSCIINYREKDSYLNIAEKRKILNCSTASDPSSRVGPKFVLMDDSYFGVSAGSSNSPTFARNTLDILKAARYFGGTLYFSLV
jgi:hypothetical protein